MKTIVLSLGGSLIVPDNVDFNFIHKFKKTIEKHYKDYRFVVVCGGGSIARKYIGSLKKENKPEKELSLAGIRATRMNALFMTQFFGNTANSYLPKDMKEAKALLLKNNVVFCGALRYSPEETSDGNAAKLAHFLKTDFINITNVNGLYTDDPKKNHKAKLIPEITWKDFERKALSIKYQPGQHFVLDQEAATIIRKHRIKTYIIGSDLSNLDKILSNKPFVGTAIQDDKHKRH